MDELSVLARIKKYLGGLISYGEVTASQEAEYARHLQVKTSTSRLLDNVVQIENFGFSSKAPIGSEVLTTQIGDDKGAVVAVVVSNRKQAKEIRQKLKAGDTCIYSADGGASIILGQDGKIEIKSGKAITVEGEEIKFGQDATDLVVTTKCACVMGGFHPQGTEFVKSKTTTKPITT